MFPLKSPAQLLNGCVIVQRLMGMLIVEAVANGFRR